MQPILLRPEPHAPLAVGAEAGDFRACWMIRDLNLLQQPATEPGQIIRDTQPWIISKCPIPTCRPRTPKSVVPKPVKNRPVAADPDLRPPVGVIAAVHPCTNLGIRR